MAVEHKLSYTAKEIDRKLGQVGIQSDWNQSDNTKIDYIKNRTHYETVPEFDITWDGDMTGRITLDLSSMGYDGTYLVHVDDTVLTVEQMLGAKTLNTIDNGEYGTTSLSDMNTETFAGAILINNFDIVVVYNVGDVSAALGLPDGYLSNGVYFSYEPELNRYISHFVGATELKKLDWKFLPDDVVKSAGAKVEGRMFPYGEISVAAGEGAEIFNDYVGNVVIGAYSHAEGASTCAEGAYSHAEGAYTEAIGAYSHAEGASTCAEGAYSHAEGVCTQAIGSEQHVQGRYNIVDTGNKYAHIVGNGDGAPTSRYTQSNAHTLDWDGNAWFAGDVYVGSTSGVNRDDGSKKLATQDYVDSNSSRVQIIRLEEDDD